MMNGIPEYDVKNEVKTYEPEMETERLVVARYINLMLAIRNLCMRPAYW